MCSSILSMILKSILPLKSAGLRNRKKKQNKKPFLFIPLIFLLLFFDTLLQKERDPSLGLSALLQITPVFMF